MVFLTVDIRKGLEFRRGAGAAPPARRSRSFPSGGFRAACAGIVLLALGHRMLLLGAESASEPEVKAAFLYNFTKFIEWPFDAPRPTPTEFTFCFTHDEAIGRALDRLVLGKVVNGKFATVRRITRGSDIRGCDVFFVGPSETQPLFRTLPPEESFGVLTVGEEEQFLDKGGIINFTLSDNRVRFEINLDAAERAGLHISSKLLNLAKVVQTKRREERR